MGQLLQYLAANNLTQSAFAERVGCKQAQISAICGGHSKPSLPLAVRIERETKGAVPAASWVPEDTAPMPCAEAARLDSAERRAAE